MAVPASPPRTVTRLSVLAAALILLAPAAVVGAEGGGEDAGRSNGLYTEPGLEYVAIAPTHLARYLTPLIEWKMDRGVPAQVFNMEQIVATYSGRDDAERLHNFLQDLYHNHTEGRPLWLLLAGDSDQIPVRYLWADRYHNGDTQAARSLYVGDTYYSGLDSDWDTDGDDVFGEPGEEDLLPELYVGRIAASLPEEMEAAVGKILNYELDPPTGDWYDNAFLAGALMDEPNRLDDPYTLPNSGGFSDEGFDPYTDNAYEITQKIRAIMGEDRDIIELVDYPFFEGCRYTAANDTLNQKASANAWARGNAFVFMASHGYEAFGGLAEYEGTGYSGMFQSARPFIVTSDTIVDTTGGMLPMVYISSCYAGQFDKADVTNFEQMITVPEGGAIALIAGDGDTFRLENISYESFGNWWLSERFWELVLDEGLVRPGEALYTLKQEYHTYYLTEGPPASDKINMDYFYANLYAYNLQGDPEVPVWVGEPGRLDMEVLSGAVFNSMSFRIQVTDANTDEPVEGATVHARGAGLDGLLEAVTDADGVATFPTGPSILGDQLRLAVTKDNWVSDREVITVGEGARDLRLSDGDVSGPSSIMFTGDIISFFAKITNTGDFTATGITVRFDSGDPNAPDGEGVDNRYQTRTVDLAPGGSTDLEFRHRYTSAGQYDIIVLADPEDTYLESNELDNEGIHHLALKSLATLPESLGPFEAEAGRVMGTVIELDDHVIVPQGASGMVEFQLGEVTEGIEAWIDPADRLFIRPSEGFSGIGGIQVEMHSEGVLADTMMVSLVVETDNAAPMIVPIPDQQVEAGDTLEVVVNATDPDSDQLMFTTSLAGATFDGPVLRWTPGDGDAGVHFPSVVVTDDQGASKEVRFRLTVNGVNSIPTLQGFEDEVTVEKGEKVHIPVSAVDADNEPLSYHLASPDEGFTIDSATGMVTFDAEGKEPGEYTATVVVTDGKAAAERVLEVTVEGSSSVPSLALMLAGVALLVAVVAVFAIRR
jgi:hypothetical protein